MPSLTQMNKKQLIEKLTDTLKDKEECKHFINELPNMKRKELISLIRDDVKTVSKSMPAEQGAVIHVDLSIPKMGDEGWTDYVLSLLRKNEMQDGNPTLFGLRRIAQKLLSSILECRTDIKQIPNPANNHTATVVVSVKFAHGSVWYGAADVSKLNCMEEYAKHPTATAESRAEGRALRKALGINVHTADEVGLDPIDTNDDGLISTNQVSSIDAMANKRLNISIGALLSSLGIKDRATNELTVEEGIQVLSKLQGFLNEPESIPEEIKNAH